MTSVDLTVAADRLHAERTRLTNLRERLLGEPAPPDQASDVSDAAAATSVTERVLTQVAAIDVDLAEVDAALARVAAGTYGRCVRCGGDVGEDRLEVLPAAALCRACQSAAEGAWR